MSSATTPSIESDSLTNKSDSSPSNDDKATPSGLEPKSAECSSAATVSSETESGKLSSRIRVTGQRSSTDIEERTLTCQVSIQRCNGGSNKAKKDDAPEEKEDNRPDTKRKARKCKQSSKTNAPRGKGRRFIFKKNVAKTPTAASIPVSLESLMYEGQYFQVGDIISVDDIEGGRYFAQIRGLLQDQYCEKSAALTWLLPTIYSPPPSEKFDPATYIIGQEEEIPRKMEYLTFICHAPSDYYKIENSPYPTFSNFSNAAHIWASMSAVDCKTKSHPGRSSAI